MPLPATYVKVTAKFKNTTTGSVANSVFWYLKDTGPDATLSTVTTYANNFKTAYETALSAWLPDACQVQAITFKQVIAGTEVEGQNSNGVIGGSVTGFDILPEEDVLCIQRRTGLVGRNKRGRVFIPYVSEDFQEDGELNAGGLANALLIATMIKSDVTAGTAVFFPCTPDWKNSVLVPVVQAGIVRQVCSRRDRRDPKVLQVDRV